MSKHIDLMRLHDGELSEDEAAELAASLAEADLRVLQGLDDLGERIREANAHASIDLTDSILARLDEPAAPIATTAPVHELRPRRNGAWIAGGLALAAAAAVAFWLTNRAGPPPAPIAQPVPVVTPAPAPEPVPTEAVAELLPEDEELTAPAASIEAVDFGNSNGSIFMVRAGEETTPVVWLPDDSEPSSRMEPL